MCLPNIANAKCYVDDFGFTVVEMNEGYKCYDKEDYSSLTDENGIPRQPIEDEIFYFNRKFFASSVTKEEIEERIVVVPEATNVNG